MNARINFKTYFEQQHRDGNLVVFPTGMGSEISELGAQHEPFYELQLPLWAVGALLDETGQKLVRQVHLNTALVGKSDIMTSATWMRRTAFQDIGLGEQWEQASQEAFARGVRIMVDARSEVEAASKRPIYAGGSFGPLTDSHSYDPAKLLPDDYLLRTHTRTARILVEAAPDELGFLIPETACHAQEAWAMGRAAASVGKPFIIGLTPGEDGNLRDGSALRDIVARLSDLNGFTAIAFNCIEVPFAERALEKLAPYYHGPFVVYANGLGQPHANGKDWVFDNSEYAVRHYSDIALKKWASKHGVTGIGGCCGTTSRHYGRLLGTTLDGERARRTLMMGNSSGRGQVPAGATG